MENIGFTNQKEQVIMFAKQFYLLVFAIGALHVRAQSSVDGFAYACTGDIYFAFSGDTSIVCLDEFSNLYECGTYNYSGSSGLSGTFAGVDFAATDLLVEDGLLVSFLVNDSDQRCNLQLLDVAETDFISDSTPYVHLECERVNPVPSSGSGIGSVSFQTNAFNLYPDGRAHFVQLLKLTGAFRDTIRTDYHGVFVWDGSDSDAIKFYFGPQAGDPLMILDGTLSDDGELFISSWNHVGDSPCFLDFEYTLDDTSILPRTDMSNGGLGDGLPDAPTGMDPDSGLGNGQSSGQSGSKSPDSSGVSSVRCTYASAFAIFLVIASALV